MTESDWQRLKKIEDVIFVGTSLNREQSRLLALVIMRSLHL